MANGAMFFAYAAMWGVDGAKAMVNGAMAGDISGLSMDFPAVPRDFGFLERIGDG